MPQLVVDDPSFGEALGALAKGFNAGLDPKRRAEALYLQSRIDNAAAATRQTELENENKIRQRVAEDEAAAAISGQLQPGKFSNLPATVTAPAPSPEFVGPMPDVPNPARQGLDDRLAVARAIAVNAIRRGGTPEQAAAAAYQSLGMAQVYATGIPTNEGSAQRVNTLLQGKIGDARVPLTEEQRRVLAQEEVDKASGLKKQETDAAMAREQVQQQAAMERERLQQEQLLVRQREHPVVAGENTTVLMSPQQREVMGLPPEGPIPVQRSAGKDEIVETPGRPTLYGPGADPAAVKKAAGPYGGTGLEAQDTNVVLETNRKIGAGEAISQDEAIQYALAFNRLFDEKTEYRAGANGAIEKIVSPRKPPPGLVHPDSFNLPRTLPPQPQGPDIPPEIAAKAAAGVPPAISPDGTAVTTVVKGTEPAVPEHQKRSATFLATMKSSHIAMNDMVKKGFRPSFTGAVLGPSAQPGGGSLSNAVQTALMNKGQGSLDPDSQLFQVQSTAFLNAVLRDESGAAVPQEEYPKYQAVLIPMYGDTEPVVQAKIKKQLQVMQARQDGMNLENIKALATAPLDVQSGSAPSPTAPAATPPAGTPKRRRVTVDSNGNIVEMP